MNKHPHVDEVGAKKIASEMLKGKANLIVACHECREKIADQLHDLTKNGPREASDMAIMHKYQMEIVATHYRQALRQSTNGEYRHMRFEALSKLPVLNDQNRLVQNQPMKEAV